MNYVMGVDIGTQSTKALLVDAQVDTLHTEQP